MLQDQIVRPFGNDHNMNLYRSHDLINPDTKLVLEGGDLVVTSGITRGDAVTSLAGLSPGDGYTLQSNVVPMAINYGASEWSQNAETPATSAELTFMTDTALIMTTTIFETKPGHCVIVAPENMAVGREYILIAINHPDAPAP